MTPGLRKQRQEKLRNNSDSIETPSTYICSFFKKKLACVVCKCGQGANKRHSAYVEEVRGQFERGSVLLPLCGPGNQMR